MVTHLSSPLNSCGARARRREAGGGLCIVQGTSICSTLWMTFLLLRGSYAFSTNKVLKVCPFLPQFETPSRHLVHSFPQFMFSKIGHPLFMLPHISLLLHAPGNSQPSPLHHQVKKWRAKE